MSPFMWVDGCGDLGNGDGLSLDILFYSRDLIFMFNIQEPEEKLAKYAMVNGGITIPLCEVNRTLPRLSPHIPMFITSCALFRRQLVRDHSIWFHFGGTLAVVLVYAAVAVAPVSLVIVVVAACFWWC
jgi:hypothetical protein